MQQWRSHLIFSALNMHQMGKAFASGASAVAIDLEDSVPMDRKSEAMLGLMKDLKENGVPRKVQIRVNHWQYSPGYDEFRHLEESHVLDMVSELIVPKVRCVEDIHDTVHDFPCVVVIEEAMAVVNLEQICSARNVKAIILGRSDMSRALGLTDRFSDLTYVRQKMAVVGHAFGKQVGDCCHIVRDQYYMRQTWQESRSFGMTFGACVHPSQVALANEIFAVHAQDKLWCHQVVRGEEEKHGLPYIHQDGGVVGTPHFRAAKNILERA